MDAIERRKWLMSMSEEESFKLPMGDWYDRIRFLREEIGRSATQGNRPTKSMPAKEKTSPRAYNSPRKPFDRWSD